MLSSSLTLAVLVSGVDGFAYAPNFITKIIAESTNLEPVGLSDVSSSSSSSSWSADAAPSPEAVEVPGDTAQGVVTRFPPEPNGYLHLGHAKAVSFNFAVARMFPNGRCNMRLDDTNPSKEGQEYVDSILEDVRWIQQGEAPFQSHPDEKDDAAPPSFLGPWSEKVRMTSDYFRKIYECAVALIESGDAYVESLSAEEMREYRGTLTEPGKPSPYRSRTVQENLDLFEKMKNGQCAEGEHVLRAKIDISSPNMNMRDPTLYRIKHESHQASGDEWCIYPMYDFSHPIADAVEGVTYSLCTLEFEDHRPLYDWTIQKLMKLGLLDCAPRQIEFSRLNLKYTVLSKRKLIQLVENGLVNGWDDPRMPTLSGVRRRGVPPQALRLFCERVGISKSDSNIDFDVLEDCVREVMDASSARAFAVLNPLKVTVTNWDGSALEDFEIPRHPKLEELGDRTVPFGRELYIERTDFFDTEGPEGQASGGRPPKGFKRLLPGGKVRLKYAYVIQCQEVVRDSETGEPLELKCTLFPETRAGVTPKGEERVKGIIHWVEASTAVRCQVNQYDRLFQTEEPGRDTGDFLNDLNPDSLEVLSNVFVEPSVVLDALNVLSQLRQYDTNEKLDEKLYHSNLSYQFERSGFFALDSDTTMNRLVFNRVVTLRDTWGAAGGGSGASEATTKSNPPRRRGGDKQEGGSKGGDVVEDVRRVALRAATILEVSPHPEADNLLVCKVDCGDVAEDGSEAVEPRTVVAGLAGKISMAELVGRKIVVVTNLKPAKMRGIESTAMILAASDEENVELLVVPDEVPNGELISFEGKDPSQPDAMLKSKGALKAWDRVKASLRANSDGEATFVQEVDHRMMSSGGPIKTTTLKDVAIQ